MTAALPPMDFTGRLERVRAAFGVDSARYVFSSSLANIRYLTGFSGSTAALLLSAEKVLLFVDGRYAELARQQCVDTVEIVDIESSTRLFETIESSVSGVRGIVVDPSQITVDVHARLLGITESIAFERGVIERLRLVKDAGEVARIRQATDVSVRALQETRAMLAAFPTEKEFASALEAALMANGADAVGFSTIVASGPNSAKPHATPSRRPIAAGEPVIVDFGGVVDGYHSDVARTLIVGEPRDDRWGAINEAARAAHDAGVAAIRPGVTHAEVDEACRTAFAEHGFGGKSLHPSGHNVGLEIHEQPFLSPHFTEPLDVGYVLTVEPGLYDASAGACRVEDIVLVTETGCDVLSAALA